MAWVLSATVASGPSDAALPLDGSGRPIPPTGTTPTIDGVNWNNTTVLVSGGGVLNSGTRVFLNNQGGSPGAPHASNGVWNFQGQGNHMTRPTNPNDYITGQVLDNETVVRVSQGTALAHTEHSCITQGTITVDTTAIGHSRQFVRANLRDFQTTGTTNLATSAYIGSGSMTLNTNTTPFTSGNAVAGMPVVVIGAGPG